MQVSRELPQEVEDARGYLNQEEPQLKEKYVPTKQEALTQYEINIQFLSRGCVIRVGCKTLAFSSTIEAIEELKKYFDNPCEMQESWRKVLA